MKTPSFHSIKKEEKDKSHEKIIEAYTFWTKKDFEDEFGYPRVDIDSVDDGIDNYKVCAVRVDHGDTQIYYVKTGKYAKLFNPIGLYSEWTEQQRQRTNDPVWKLEKVNKNVFDFYVDFLRTKNEAYLKNAERVMI